MKSTFSGFIAESDDQLLVTEAFNSAPYDLTFGKKSAGDIFFTFHDEDDKEFRIQFYTPQGLGRNVRQVFIGTRKGASYLDSQQKFKNPLRVASTMIDATKQFLDTPIGKSIDGFAINFSKKVMDRGIKLLPKIIRQSGLKQKLNVMDLNYSPDDSRGFVWVVRKGKDPAAVFDGPKMKGITWDDPDKVGDVPVQQPAPANSSGEMENGYILPDRKMTPFQKNNFINDQKIAKLLVELRKVDPGFQNDEDGDTTIIYDSKGGKFRVDVEFEGNHFDNSVTAEYSVMVGGSPFNTLAVQERRKRYPDFKSAAKGIASMHAMAVKEYLDNPESVNDSKWKALTNVMSLTSLHNTVKTTDAASIGQVIHNGVKMIVGLVRGKESVYLNLDAYDASTNQQINLPISVRRYTDIDVNRPDNLRAFVNTAIEKAIEVASRENLSTGPAAKPELNQTRWLALQRASVNIPGMTSVVSSTTAVGRLYVGNQGSVIVSINKGVLWNDDPVTVTIKAIDSKENPLDYSFIMRGIDITKPAELTKAVKAKVDEAVKLINTKVPPSAALDAQSMLTTLKILSVDRRDIDWQFVESGNGKITVIWDLTFRRNTRQGAFKEHASSIRDANAAMNRMQLALQNKGYKTEIYLVTLQDAIDIDTQAEVEDGTAYSEYEQSIGSQLTGTK